MTSLSGYTIAFDLDGTLIETVGDIHAALNHVLTAEGLVRHEPRRGCFVNEVTEQDLDEIFPVIALLEGRGHALAEVRSLGPVEAIVHDAKQDLLEGGSDRRAPEGAAIGR